MSTFVLVHGAWGAGREFDEMARLLSAAGHDVIAVDLPGHGDNQALPWDVTLDAYVSEVARAIEDAGKDVLLAGHSLGGAVISRVAERFPESVQSLIYIAAILPASGSTAIEIMQSGGGELMPYARLSKEDRTVSLDPEAVSRVMLNDVTNGAVIDRMRPHFRMKQPVGPLGARIDLSTARFGAVPKYYVRTSLDRVIPPSLQARMLENWRVEKVYELDAGHFPFVSVPTATAEALNDVDTHRCQSASNPGATSEGFSKENSP